MRIPKINLDKNVYQGTEQAQLAKGPGHYPSCGRFFAPPYCSTYEEVWPGERGRVIVGGHRSLGHADFFNLNRLRPGDRIYIQAKWGRFIYAVERVAVVDDDDSSTITPKVSRREMMLVTCHPKWSAAQRLLVFAVLKPPTRGRAQHHRLDKAARLPPVYLRRALLAGL
jgi:sortase A